VDLDALLVGVLLLHLLIGILFVVILVVIIHKFLAIAFNQLLMHSTLQDKRVQVVAELFKADNNLTASAPPCSRTALRQWFYHALVEMVIALLLPVQRATAHLAVALGVEQELLLILVALQVLGTQQLVGQVEVAQIRQSLEPVFLVELGLLHLLLHLLLLHQFLFLPHQVQHLHVLVLALVPGLLLVAYVVVMRQLQFHHQHRHQHHQQVATAVTSAVVAEPLPNVYRQYDRIYTWTIDCHRAVSYIKQPTNLLLL